MGNLNPDIVAEVVRACQTGAEEGAGALGRALGSNVRLSVAEPGSLSFRALPAGFDGPGLAIVLTVGDAGALILIPESSGLLPDWYSDPDPTGQSKLATLAQELGIVLLPDDCMPDGFRACKVRNLSEAVVRAGVSDGAPIVPLHLRLADGGQTSAHLVWPAAHPGTLFEEGVAESNPEVESDPGQAVPPTSGAPPETPTSRGAATVDDLPQYSRSLLRIKLPVVVTLARQRQPLNRIIELGPGSILQFEKSCEEMLELDVGGHSIATGEAVKVGDKFGLRINSMILPEERFLPVHRENSP